MENRVLKTEEIFRITYMDGEFERLMKQTYTNDAPFYYVMKGVYDLTPVETSNHDLSVIESHLKRCLEIDSTSLKQKHNINNPNVLEVIKHCLDKQKEFLNKLQEYMLTECLQTMVSR